MLVVPRLVLVTTRVMFYRPDYPSLLSELTWQTEDRAPDLPKIRRYIEHWRREIEAVIASIEIATSESRDWRSVEWQTHLS